jgi:hypothetical protein
VVQRTPAGCELKPSAIPFLDLQAEYRALRGEINAAVARVLSSGQFILGREGDALEREVAAYCGAKHAVAVASGTDALELSLRARLQLHRQRAVDRARRGQAGLRGHRPPHLQPRRAPG